MRPYEVRVEFAQSHWMIDVPELDGHRGADGLINVGSLTQARHYTDIEQEARDFICTVVDAAPSAVDLDVHIDVDGLDVGDAAAAIAADRATAKEAEARAISRSTDVAVRLSEAGVPMREIGEIVGVTHQRVDQLIKGAPSYENWKLVAGGTVKSGKHETAVRVTSGRTGGRKTNIVVGTVSDKTAARPTAKSKRS